MIAMRGLLRIRSYFSMQSFDVKKDYYKVLKLQPNATEDEIKKGFRALAKLYHPDTNKGKEEQFKEINEAYQILSDYTLKKDYDEARSGRRADSTQSHSQHKARRQQEERARYYDPAEDFKESWRSDRRSQNQYRGYTKENNWESMSQGDRIAFEFMKSRQQMFRRERERTATKTEPFQQMYRRQQEQIRRRQQEAKFHTRVHTARRKDTQQMQKFYQEFEQQQRRQKEEYLNKVLDETVNKVVSTVKGKVASTVENVAKKVMDDANIEKVKDSVSKWWNQVTKKK